MSLPVTIHDIDTSHPGDAQGEGGIAVDRSDPCLHSSNAQEDGKQDPILSSSGFRAFLYSLEASFMFNVVLATFFFGIGSFAHDHTKGVLWKVTPFVIGSNAVYFCAAFCAARRHEWILYMLERFLYVILSIGFVRCLLETTAIDLLFTESWTLELLSLAIPIATALASFIVIIFFSLRIFGNMVNGALGKEGVRLVVMDMICRCGSRGDKKRGAKNKESHEMSVRRRGSGPEDSWNIYSRFRPLINATNQVQHDSDKEPLLALLGDKSETV